MGDQGREGEGWGGDRLRPSLHPPLAKTASQPVPLRQEGPGQGSLGRGVQPQFAQSETSSSSSEDESETETKTARETQQGNRLSPWRASHGKGHGRSLSHGGVAFQRTGSGRETAVQDPAAAAGGQQYVQQHSGSSRPLQSALKKPGGGHRRGFSHGQINPEVIYCHNYYEI